MKNKQILTIGGFLLLAMVGVWFLPAKKTKNIETKINVKIEEKTVTKMPVPEDCLGSDWGSRERCLKFIESVVDFDSCVNAGFATASDTKCQTPEGKVFNKEETKIEQIDLVGEVQELGNLACPCFVLKTSDGKSQSVRYGLFLSEDKKENVDVSNIRNGYRVRVVGTKEKKIDPRAFVEILLDKIEIVDKK